MEKIHYIEESNVCVQICETGTVYKMTISKGLPWSKPVRKGSIFCKCVCSHRAGYGTDEIGKYINCNSNGN